MNKDDEQLDRIEWLLRDIYDRMGWSIEASLTLQRAKVRDNAEDRAWQDTKVALAKERDRLLYVLTGKVQRAER